MSGRTGRLGVALLAACFGARCGPAPRAASDFFPALAPDGSRVVFSSIPFETGDSELWAMDARGGARRQLTSLRAESAREMAAGGFAPGAVRSLSLYPAVSPDGSAAAFVNVRRSPVAVTPALHRLDLSSGALETILEIAAQRIGPVSWSPDGKQLAFVTDRSGRYELWRVSSRGGEPTRLTSLEHHVWSSTWAPAGVIVFAANPRSDGSIAYEPRRAGGFELFALDPASGRVEQLTTNGHDDMSPAWDPTASRVAFVSREAGEWRLNVLDWRTRVIITVHRSGCYLDHPSWRPDGGALVVTRGSSREFEGYFNDLALFEVSVPDGAARALDAAEPSARAAEDCR